MSCPRRRASVHALPFGMIDDRDAVGLEHEGDEIAFDEGSA